MSKFNRTVWLVIQDTEHQFLSKSVNICWIHAQKYFVGFFNAHCSI